MTDASETSLPYETAMRHAALDFAPTTHARHGKRAERAEKALQDETGWLIERRAPETYRPAWLSLRITSIMGSPLGSWEFDSVYALRFARRSDAEEYVRAHGLEGCTVTEHEWIGARMTPSLASKDHPQEKNGG